MLTWEAARPVGAAGGWFITRWVMTLVKARSTGGPCGLCCSNATGF